jgi:integrase
MSIHREGKKYRVRWRQGDRQHSRTFDRKHDADLFDAELRRRRQLGPTLARDVLQATITLDEFIRTGFRTHAVMLAPASRRHYRWALENHLTGLLDTPLAAIDVPMLATYQHRLLDTGRTPNTVREAMTKLSGILQVAVEHGHIAANPVHSLRKTPREPRDEVRPLSPVDLERLIAALTGRDRAIVLLAGHLGLRPIEVRMGLWDALGSDTFTVGRARTKKTAARTRVLAVPQATMLELKRWRMEAGRPDDESPIIGDATASALNQWTWKTLKPKVADVLGRHDVTLYTLRHSHASALHYCGFTVVDAARRLGHGPMLHVKTYAHVIDSLGTDRYPGLDALITAARDTMEHTDSAAEVPNRS